MKTFEFQIWYKVDNVHTYNTVGSVVASNIAAARDKARQELPSGAIEVALHVYDTH